MVRSRAILRAHVNPTRLVAVRFPVGGGRVGTEKRVAAKSPKEKKAVADS